MIVSGSLDGSVRTWDAHTGKAHLTYRASPGFCVAFSPRGDRLVSALVMYKSGFGRCLIFAKGFRELSTLLRVLKARRPDSPPPKCLTHVRPDAPASRIDHKEQAVLIRCLLVVARPVKKLK